MLLYCFFIFCFKEKGQVRIKELNFEEPPENLPECSGRQGRNIPTQGETLRF